MRLLAAAAALLCLIGTAAAQPLSDNYPQPDELAVQTTAKAGAVTASRSCLAPDAQAVLTNLERRFGPVKVISTCRPGARIAGTNKPSHHATGRAVDFIAPRGRKAEVVRWLYQHNSGLVMTYAAMGHVHFDVGPYHAIACGGCGKRPARDRHRIAAAQ